MNNYEFVYRFPELAQCHVKLTSLKCEHKNTPTVKLGLKEELTLKRAQTIEHCWKGTKYSWSLADPAVI